MADEYKYVTTTGVVVPDTSALKATVEAEWRAALGDDLAVTSDTPQGVLIAAETAARAEVLRTNAAVANQINPNLSGGVFLDALCALLGLERATATRTLVRAVTLTGVPSTPVPAGVLAKTAAGDLFESVGAVSIGGGGTVTVDFQSVEVGSVPCAIGALSEVVDSVLGWETVNNTTAGEPGTNEQSDESLRDLRRRTLARQGISTVEAIVSDVSAVPNVRSMQFRENIGAAPAVIDGIAMAAHSVWACVDGGTDAAIAWALFANKTNGAAWNGAVSVDVLEPYSGQTYNVLFDRPTAVPMIARVTVRKGSSLVDAQVTVRDAIVAYANGELDGERGFVVGGNVSPFELAGAVAQQVPGLFVAKVEVATAAGGPGTYQTTEVAIALNQLASISTGDVTVVEV
jgi:uncharacterized phage protein gp47/JayE